MPNLPGAKRRSANLVSPIEKSKKAPLPAPKSFDPSTQNTNSPLYQQIVKNLSSKINALKNNQLQIVQLEEQFYTEIHALECKYMKLYEPFFEARELIVSGEHEVSGAEGVWALDETEMGMEGGRDDSGTGQDVKELIKDMESKIDISKASKAEDFVGVPHFWLQVFKRTDLIMDMVQPQDEDVLLYLTDIKSVMKDTKPYGFDLEFHFRQNEYFTNKVLTKSYELSCERDNFSPLSYDGPVMYRCQGCSINWCQGKDVTLTQVKKRQKHKATGTVRVVMKEEKQDSFFNYFDTPTADGVRPSYRSLLYPEMTQSELDEFDDDDYGEDLCNADFEIGHFFKEFIVPKAVLYYTGEMVDNCGDDDGNDGSGEIEGFFPDGQEEDGTEDESEEGSDEDMEEELK